MPKEKDKNKYLLSAILSTIINLSIQYIFPAVPEERTTMLSRITHEEFDAYIDFAWQLALDPSRSGYPSYTDQIKTKEDFIRIAREGMEKENDEILLFRQNGSVEGWIHYFQEPEEQYLQTCTFNIRTGTAAAMEEFLDYIQDKFPGFQACLGFPGENQSAAETLLKHGFTCIEESFNNSLFFDSYTFLPEEGDVRTIDAENYQDFRTLHAPCDAEMYWNSDRILAAISRWSIHVAYRNGQPAGAVYFYHSKPMPEIFGMDYPDDVFDSSIARSLLIRALNEAKQSGAEYMTWFTDERHQPVAQALGFFCVGKYLCFEKEL